MVDDIEDFLNGNDRLKTKQRILGVSMIFRGFIVKDWHGDNVNCKEYLEFKKAIVKLCVAYYWKFWEERNEAKFKPEIRRKFVVEWYKRQIEKAKMSVSAEVRKYIREYELQVDDRPTDQIQRWFIGLNMVIKRAKDHKVNDIRRYVN